MTSKNIIRVILAAVLTVLEIVWLALGHWGVIDGVAQKLRASGDAGKVAASMLVSPSVHFALIATAIVLFVVVLNELRKQKVKPESVQSPVLPIDVYEPFKDLHRHVKLGNALGKEQTVSKLYFAEFKTAFVFWEESRVAFFRLVKDGKESGTWTQRNDPHDQGGPLDPHKGAQYSNEVWLRQRFQVPADKLPPYGGVAQAWDNYSEDWERLTYMNWHCEYFDQTVRQEFERGFIIGGIPSHRGAPHIVEAYAVIYNESDNQSGKWERRKVVMPIPKCETPPEWPMPK